MRKNINRKYNLPTRGKFIHALLFLKSTIRWDTSYLLCLLHVPQCFRITLIEFANDSLHVDYSFQRNSCLDLICKLRIIILFF